MTDHAHTARRALPAGLALVAISMLAPGARAQTAPNVSEVDPNVIYACYVPTSGTVYRIRTTDTREECAAKAHGSSGSTRLARRDRRVSRGLKEPKWARACSP